VDLVAVATVENTTTQQPCQIFEEYPVLLALDLSKGHYQLDLQDLKMAD
jgi:hypothetical protein